MQLLIWPNHTASHLVAGRPFRTRCILLTDDTFEQDASALSWWRYDEGAEDFVIISNDIEGR